MTRLVINRGILIQFQVNLTATNDGGKKFNADDERTVLLLLPDRQELYPTNIIALSQAQKIRRQVKKEYQNAFILDTDCTLRKFEEITILGLIGDLFGSILFSMLQSCWLIKVHLSDQLPCYLEQIKKNYNMSWGIRNV